MSIITATTGGSFESVFATAERLQEIAPDLYHTDGSSFQTHHPSSINTGKN